MALINPIDKTLTILELITDNQESKAAAEVGLTCDNTDTALANTPYLLNKVCELANRNYNMHDSGVLVDSASKHLDSKELVSSALDICYSVNESVSLLVTNAINSLSCLTEDTEEMRAAVVVSGDDSDGPMIDPNEGMDNIKNSYTDGLMTAKDALIDIFADTAKLHNSVRALIRSKIGDSGKLEYVDLVGNAVTGAGMMYAICGMSKFKDSINDDVNECTNSVNVLHRADNILFASLSLQESLINFYIGMKRFNKDVINLFEGVANEDTTGDPFADANGFFKTALDSCVKDTKNLGSAALSKQLELGVEAVAALYDEYLQDYVEACNDTSSTADTVPAADVPAPVASEEA